MKEFNKDKELTKLKLKNNNSKYIKYGSIILSVLILVIGIIYFTFAKFESNQSYTLIEGKVNYSTSDVNVVAYYYDGSKHDEPPTKNNGYVIKSVNCDNASGTWSNSKWELKLSNISGKTKCSLEFEKSDDSSTILYDGVIIDLGENTTFDIKTLASNVDYTKLTNDNFYVSEVSSCSKSGDEFCNDGRWNYGSVSSSPTKSYDATTGILTMSNNSTGTYCDGRCGCQSATCSGNAHAYLIIPSEEDGTIRYLGKSTSFDIKKYAPDIDYTKLTNDNFYISEVYSCSNDGNQFCYDGRSDYGSVSSSTTKNYDATTGILSMYLNNTGNYCDTNCGCQSVSCSGEVEAYLIIN